MARCLIGLGSNLGDRAKYLEQAVELIGKLPHVEVDATSSWMQSNAIGGPDGQGPFLNGVSILRTSLSASQLLPQLLQIEQSLGRQRRRRWSPRSIDLDVLLYDQHILRQANLVIPHPWMAIRRFVVQPAAEVAGDIVHPEIGWSMQRLAKHLGAARPFVAVTGVPEIPATSIVAEASRRSGAAFIPDPASPAKLRTDGADGPRGDAGIELLRNRRSGLLDQLEARPTFCDFWLDETLAFADGNQDEVVPREELEFELGLAPEADLVVVLTIANLPPKSRYLQETIVRHATRPGRGPFLILEADNPTVATDLLQAAIEGMQ